MQTKKRAKPVKFGSKKDSADREEKLSVVEQPEEKEPQIISHQKVIRISESDEQQAEGKPIIISQNVQITRDSENEEKADEVIPVTVTEEISNKSIKKEEPPEPPELVEEQEPVTEEEDTEVEERKEIIKTEDEKEEVEESPSGSHPPAFVTKESSFGKGFTESKEEKLAEPEPSNVFRGFGNDDYEEEKKSNPFLFFIIVVVVTFVLALVLIGGATFLAGDKFFGELSLPSFVSSPEPTPTPEEKPEPSPTPEEKVDKAAYSIKVLNGSGITGEAAKVKAALTTSGFTVSGLGNAESSDYTQTQITFKSEVKEPFIKALREELEKTYSVGSATEDAEQTTDVVVTIGSETTQ